MRTLAAILTVFIALQARGQEITGPETDSGQPAILPTGIGLSTAGMPQSMNLKGLWALHVSANIGVMSNDDVRGFFPAAALTLSDKSTFYGFSLRVHHHLNDYFYVGVGLDNLSKSYNLRASDVGITEVYQFTALDPSLTIGFTFGRSQKSYFFAELQGGWIFLNQAGFEQQGGSNATGNFEGATLSTVFSLGANWFVIPSVGLHLSVGWRNALIDDVTFTDASGATISAQFIPSFFVDFGGPQGRLGITFFWGMNNPWGDMHDSPPPPKGSPPG